MNEERFVLVTAGIIVDDHRVLICQRHHSDSYGLQWEFPGGKVQDGETPRETLSRELMEELGILAEVGEEVHRLRYRYPDRLVEVVFFRVPSYRGRVQNRIFEDVAWVAPAELPSFKFLEADRELVQRIVNGEIV